MKIPDKYQIFNTPVVLTDKDHDRLAPHLSGWPRLHQLFQSGVINQPDLQRLIIIELMDRKRLMLIHRLLGRLESITRKEVERRIARCLRK